MSINLRRAAIRAAQHDLSSAADLADALAAFLRAPVTSSSGPGSVTLEVQTFNRDAAMKLLRSIEEFDQ